MTAQGQKNKGTEQMYLFESLKSDRRTFRELSLGSEYMGKTRRTHVVRILRTSGVVDRLRSGRGVERDGEA